MNKNFTQNCLSASVLKIIYFFILLTQFSSLMNAGNQLSRVISTGNKATGKFQSFLNAESEDLYQLLNVSADSENSAIQENYRAILRELASKENNRQEEERKIYSSDEELSDEDGEESEKQTSKFIEKYEKLEESYGILIKDDLRRIYNAYGSKMAQFFIRIKENFPEKTINEEEFNRIINSIEEFIDNSQKLRIFCRTNIPILFYQATKKFDMETLDLNDNEKISRIEEIITDFYISKFYQRSHINEMIENDGYKKAFLIEQNWFEAYLNEPSTKEKALKVLEIVVAGLAGVTVVAASPMIGKVGAKIIINGSRAIKLFLAKWLSYIFFRQRLQRIE